MPQASTPVPAATATENKTTPTVTAPKSGEVLSVSYDPAAKITGQNTNSRTLTLRNLGSSSNPKYTPIATLPLTAGVVLDPQQANPIPLTSTVTFDQGDQIAWQSDAVGGGLADPGGVITVSFKVN
jgi:hypothetical protein